MFLDEISLSKYDQNYKFTDFFFSPNIGHISWSQDGLVPRVKARDQVQEQVIDI